MQAVVEQPRISGTILLDGTSPLPAIQVKLYWHDGKRWKTAATTETDTDGHYTFAGLSLGVLYKVEPRNNKHTFDPAAYVDVELTEEEPTAVCNFNAYASTSKSPPGKSGTYRRPTDF